MAQDDAVTEQLPPPKNNKKRLLVIMALVVVVGLAAGAAYLLLAGGDKKKPDGRRSHQDRPAQTMLVPFDEKFTVNLRSEDGFTHYLQVPQLQLEVADADVAARVEAIKPKISDRISSLLRSKDMQSVMAPGSDLKLKQEMKQVVNEALGVRDERKGVVEVILPQSFIVQ